MVDKRKHIECFYCGAEFHIKYSSEVPNPSFCCFCSEVFEDPTLEDEEDDGDLDYSDDERNIEV